MDDRSQAVRIFILTFFHVERLVSKQRTTLLQLCAAYTDKEILSSNHSPIIEHG